MAVAIALAILERGIFGLLQLVQRIIIDDAVLSDAAPLAPWVATLVAMGALTYGLGYVRRSLGGRVAVDVQHDLQVELHRHLQHLDAAGRDGLRTGDVMSRAAADTTLIQLYLQQLSMTVGNLALVAVALVVMLVLSPLLALVVAIGVPAFLMLSVRFRDRTFPASWMDQRHQAAIAGVVEEAVTGVRIVKAFGQERQEQDLLEAEAKRLYQSRVRTARIVARFAPALQTIPMACQLAILGIGGYLVMQGEVTIGVFVAFSSYVQQLVPPVRMLSGFLATSQQARAGMHRIRELLALQPVVADRPDAQTLREPVGAVSFEHVSFRYGGGPAVLHDVSLSVAPGECLAIVGASGSGKTTLALLLSRVHEATSGHVRVDGADVAAWTLDSLRRAVGMVFEESFLFSTSIRDNIAFGRPDASDADVRRAAEIAHAAGFIAALPDGYDTVVGERGFTLSGGQRQRIALARAALVSPAVLVLDDATSAIDSRTEHAILNSFNAVMNGRTTILIAHRSSTLRLADRVVLLDGGRVVAEGTHATLLATSTLYRALLAGPEPDSAGLVRPAVFAVDPEAWPEGADRAGAARMASVAGDAVLGGASGVGGPASVVGATSLLAGLATESGRLRGAVEQLPPLSGDPDIDIDREAQPDDHFRFATLLRPFRGALALGASLVVIDTATVLATPVLVRHAVDAGVAAGSGRVLLVTCAITAAVVLLSLVNAIALTIQTSRTAERILFGLRVRTFAHLQRLSLDFYERQMAGKIMTKMTSDVDALAQLLQQGLLTAMVSLLSCVGVTVVVVVLDPRMALAVAAVLPVLVVSTVWFRRASGRSYLVARHCVSAMYANLQEGIAGIGLTQAFGQQAAQEARFGEFARAHRDARVRSAVLIARFFPLLQFLNVIAKAIALAVGAREVAGGRLSAGALVGFLLLVDQFFNPIQQLSMVFDQWLQATVAVNQLGELLRTATGTPQAVDAIDPGRLTGRIRLDHVRFAYPGTGVTAMDGVDLEIGQGQVVALVGTTGAGKSTLAKLVARFYDPTDGRVYVDDLPLDQLDLQAYRRQLGYVPQEPFLFSGTVRSNIAYGRPGASDLDVERAARAVGAHDLFAGLPLGYHTPVSEQGLSLSAGQRQLLSLARAQLVDPAILILDEATANLDLLTEANVQHAMGLVARGRTTLLIAHRLQTARAADRILVVENGRVAEDGTHDELLRHEGRYAELWSAFLVGGDVMAQSTGNSADARP
jgi:ABC-type multidrug transport system fused ATPase/permease subunit